MLWCRRIPRVEGGGGEGGLSGAQVCSLRSVSGLMGGVRGEVGVSGGWDGDEGEVGEGSKYGCVYSITSSYILLPVFFYNISLSLLKGMLVICRVSCSVSKVY